MFRYSIDGKFKVHEDFFDNILIEKEFKELKQQKKILPAYTPIIDCIGWDDLTKSNPKCVKKGPICFKGTLIEKDKCCSNGTIDYGKYKNNFLCKKTT